MYRRPVESSHIVAVGYDPENMLLEVEFLGKQGNSVYVYRGVQPQVYEAFMTAESIGRFFAQSIKGKYESQRVS